VPAYIANGFAGSNTIVETESDAMKSFTGVQLLPPLVVFQIPPPTLPANIVDGLVLLIAMARMRPPTLPGPSQRHLSWRHRRWPDRGGRRRRGKHVGGHLRRGCRLDAFQHRRGAQAIDVRLGAAVGVRRNVTAAVAQLHQLELQRIGTVGLAAILALFGFRELVRTDHERGIERRDDDAQQHDNDQL
jgi:hypothetical protein